MNKAHHKALRRAIKKAGGIVTLARELRVSHQRIAYWLDRPSGTAAEFVLPIEAATGVSRHALRPDIYPRELAA